MFAPAVAVLVLAAWFRCKRQVELFWAAFEILSYQPFAAVVAPKPPVLLEQGDRAGSHRMGLHLSFRPLSARYYGAVERNAPARSQRDKNRPPRHGSRDMK
jgi:hypothetical protein